MLKDCGDRKETLSRFKFIMSLVNEVRLRQYMAFHEQVLLLIDNEIEVNRLLNRQLMISKQKIQRSHRIIKTNENEIKTREDEIKTREDEIKTREEEINRLVPDAISFKISNLDRFFCKSSGEKVFSSIKE